MRLGSVQNSETRAFEFDRTVASCLYVSSNLLNVSRCKTVMQKLVSNQPREFPHYC